MFILRSYFGKAVTSAVRDDHKLLSWTVSTGESTKIADLSEELYPTNLHFLPRASGALGKHGDLILVTSADGKFHIINRNGRVERSVEAHRGAILVGQWSNDGVGLLTGGEDGYVKIWSRGGMLRSTVVLSDNSVYDACWSPDSQSIAYTQGKFIIIKNLAPNTKPIKWKAHEGLVLCMAWSAPSELIVSGGEDCRYRVWDNQGRSLFSSSLHDHPITCVSWSPNGDLFAVGSYNTLRLCDFWAHMLLVERSTVSIYNYQGRLIASPRWPNMRLEYLRSLHISLSPDTLAVRDYSDQKTIHILDILSLNKSNNDTTVTIQHSLPIVQIGLDQAGSPANRNLAVLDRNKDLRLVQVRSSHKTLLKLGNQIQMFEWNSEENILVAIQDVQVVVWYCPTACFNTTLLKYCSMQYDSPELGRSPRLNDFVGNFVSIRRGDGSLITVAVSPFPAVLHRYIHESKWDAALRLCRLSNEKVLWTMLAVLSTQINNVDLLEIAEEAYAAINYYDKVYYIQHLKSLPNKSQQLAGTALLGGLVQNAESILLHNGLVYQAILMNIRLHNWNRAVDLANKHKTNLDTVCYLRDKYLMNLGKEETNPKYLALKNTVTIDKEAILQKLETA